MALPPASDSALRRLRRDEYGDEYSENQPGLNSIPLSFYNPKPSRPSAFAKLLSPASLHIQIDNPLIFLHPTDPMLVIPNDDDDEDPARPSDDCVLSGKVTLSLHKPREVKKLSVGVRAHSDIGFPDRPMESQLLFTQDLDIDLRTETLEKGDHVFEWSFVVPSSLGPYERGPFGRTYHKVVAKVKGAGVIGDLESEAYWEAAANPSGNDPDGGLSLNVHFEDHSPHLGPYMIALTSTLFTVSGLLGFQLSLANTPGPLTIHFVTCHILQQFELHSESSGRTARPPRQKRRVFRIDGGPNPPGIKGRGGWISQTLSRSVSRAPSRAPSPSPTASPPAIDDAPGQRIEGGSGISIPEAAAPSPEALSQSINRRLQFQDAPSPPPHEHAAHDDQRAGRDERSSASRGASGSHHRGRDKGKKKANSSSTVPAPDQDTPLATLSKPGRKWEVHHLARLPNDDNLRPSTHPGSVTPIRVSHALSVEVVYSFPGLDSPDKRKMLTMTKPVSIYSCCCMLESLVLPAYSEWDPHAEMRDPGHQLLARMGCVCSMSTAKLLRTQDPTSNEPMEGELPPGAFAPKPQEPESR